MVEGLISQVPKTEVPPSTYLHMYDSGPLSLWSYDMVDIAFLHMQRLDMLDEKKIIKKKL